MEFNSQICTTIEQSKILLELGLKPETADMVYTNASLPFEKDRMQLIYKEYSQLDKEVNYQISPFTFIPAWSLHRLKCLLPNKIPYKSGYLTTEIINNVNLMFITDTTEQRVISFIHENLYESMIKCIKWFIKENYFNKEYLNI